MALVGAIDKVASETSSGALTPVELEALTAARSIALSVPVDRRTHRETTSQGSYSRGEPG